MKKIFSLVLATLAATTLASAAVQQVSDNVDCGSSKTIKATPKAGYHFVKWSDDITTNPRTVEVSGNVTYTATFAPNTDTKYTVKHWLQNILDNDYPATPEATETKEGTTATSTAATANSYIGFTAQTITQGVIAGDESTIVNVYYTRNLYALAWATDGNALTGNFTPAGNVKYGATLTAPNTPTKTGYVFKAWSPAFTGTMPAENTTYTATWDPATDTKYTVKHYQQNIANDEYTEVTADRQELKGTTGTTTAAAAKDYTGFNAKAFSQTTIAADGSAVVEIYYDRQTFTVTFYNGTEPLQTLDNVKYGATPVYTEAAPTKAADAEYTYVFEGNWDPALGPITGNTTYNALFTAVPKSQFLITVVVDPVGAGTVTGGGTYTDGAKATLKAESDDVCYVFDHWNDGNTDAMREVTVSGNATYTATFRKLEYEITVQSGDDTMGTVSFE